jgi:hypothetical protein
MMGREVGAIGLPIEYSAQFVEEQCSQSVNVALFKWFLNKLSPAIAGDFQRNSVARWNSSEVPSMINATN